MASPQRVGVIAEHGNTPRDLEAVQQLADALGGASVGAPDEHGAFEVELVAASYDEAVKRVVDGIAAAGADDHLRLAEHRPPRTGG